MPKSRHKAVRPAAHHAADIVGIQVPVGRICAEVEVDGARRTLRVGVGTSLDVRAKRIRAKAGTGGAASSIEGWYVLVS